MPCGLYADEAAAQARDHARAAARRSAPSGSSPSTPPPRSRARARGWSTASSCSPTCSTPARVDAPAGWHSASTAAVGNVHSAEQSAEIDAAPEACFEAVDRLRDLPRLAGGGRARRGARARRRRAAASCVRFEIDAKVEARLLHACATTTSRPPPDLVGVRRGRRRRERRGRVRARAARRRGGTRVTYRLGIDPGRAGPRPDRPAPQPGRDAALGRPTSRDEVERAGG